MKHSKTNKHILMISAVLLIAILSGCSSLGPYSSSSSSTVKYYKGYDSLTMTFMQDSPPYTFYYDGSPGANNEIPIVVEVRNKGASDAVGNIFVHGYDPHIIEVAGGPRSWPNGGYVQLPGSSGTSFNFQISNVYTGIPSHTGTQTTGGMHFTTQSGGYNYGFGVFSGSGYSTFSFALDPTRVGYRIAYDTLNNIRTYGSAYTFNAPIGLSGDSSTTPGGGMEVYEFPAYIYYLPASLEQFPQPIMITACYSYATHASTMLCIDPHPNSNVKKVCRPATVSLSGGQGAPVAVTSIEQQASSQKTVFTIHIHHSPQSSLDEVYDFNSMDKCSPDSGQIVKSSDKNIVYLEYVAVSDKDITPNCIPSNRRIRLDTAGSGEITCTLNFDATSASLGAYQAPIEVELGYGYSKNIYKQITIKKI